MNNEIVTIDEPQKAVAVAQQRPVGSTPADLLIYAMESGADLDRLERLMEMKERWEANEARKSFAEAMARFKEKPLAIYKDKHVSFKTSSGVTAYDHATIGNVCEVLVSALAEFGFSHRWVTAQESGQVIVECILTHRLGHTESVRLQSSPDTSGAKNGIQSIISAQTYLQRHTLLAICGVATKDQNDDDGKKSDVDTSLADNWIAKVKAAPTDKDVCIVWDLAIKAIEKAKDQYAYAELKKAVQERRSELVGK